MKSVKFRKRAICVFVCLLAMILSAALITASANDGEIETVGEMAGEDGIYETFKPYLVQDTAKRADKYVGCVQYTVYYDTAKGEVTAGEHGTPVMIYTVNHPGVERIGTDSNETIIRSMLERGYVVVVLDYLENAKAVTGLIEWSAQIFRYDLSEGKILDADIFPDGKYIENLAVPSGYNVLFKEVFFEIDKHATSGTLEKIVENWNSDFKDVKGKYLVKWVYEDGTRKKVANASDGSAPVWYDEKENEDANGEYTLVKYTVAETITDCVNPDGSFIDLDYYMNIVYPTNPENEVPVGVAASSGGNISCLYEEERPQYIADVYRGYAHAVYDFLWTPMARTASYGYYDGSNGITGDHINYGVQQYNDKIYNTSAIRYLRYLSVNGGDTYKFDLDKFLVIGNSKGGWFNFLGEAIIQNPLTEGSFTSVAEKQAAIDKALTALTPYKYFAGKAGETRYQLGEGAYTENGITIAAGELQPWTVYEKDCTYDPSIKAGDEIVSGIQVSHPSNGSQHEDITAGHTPIVLGANMADRYNAAYGYSNHVYNICKTLDIPLLHFENPLGHTLLSGKDLNYNVDTYKVMYDFFDYILKEDEIKVAYVLPLDKTGKVFVTDKITVKFAGIVTADEITKVTVSSGDEVLSGSWSSILGGTEWIFTPDSMKGGTEYTVTVPVGLKGENGAVMKESYESTFITEPDNATTPVTVTKAENGTYYSFTAPKISTGNGFAFRFRVENDAANTVSLYVVNSVSDTSGALLGNVRVKGVGSYEIDISDYVAANSGKKLTLLLKADNAASETVVKEESFDTFLPSATPDKNDQPNKLLTLEAGASIDGRTALKISLENAVITKGVSQFYEKSNSIFSISDITGGIKTTNGNNGRRFLIELDVYDEISRTIRFGLNRMTNRLDYGVIDYDNIFFSVNTKAGEWTHISFIYEMPDSDYGFVSNNRTQKLAFYAATNGNKASALYYDNMTVTEIITDVEFGYAAIAETDNGLGEYKAPTNTEMPISIYNYNTLVGNYNSWSAALSAYKSGYTIKLNADYTLTDSGLSDALSSFAVVNINLNGYTITSANTQSSLLWVKASNASKTTVNIFGGSVLLDRTPLVSYESGSTDGKSVSVNISNVSFGFVKGAFVTEMISASAGTSGIQQTVNISLDSCSFVLRDGDRAKDGVTVFPGSFGDDLKISYEIKGGSFYIDSQKWVTVADKAVSLKFLKNENGAYTPLYASESMFTEFTSPILSDTGYALYTRGEEVGENVVVYTLKSGDNCTEYGIIPDKYLDKEKYPIVLFDGNGDFVGAYSLLLGNSDSAIVALKDLMREKNTWNAELGIHTGVNPVILIRDDYSCDAQTYYNWAQIPGEFTIDLGGNTLSQGSDDKYLFDIQSKAYEHDGRYFYPTTLNVVNGTIATKTKHLFNMKASEQAASVTAANSISDKIFTFNFDGVTFSLMEGATVSEMMINVSNAGSSDAFDAGSTAPYFFNFNSCKFDIRNNTKSSFTIFDTATTEASKITAEFKVTGGEIIANGMQGVKIFTADGTNGSGIKFLKDDSKEYIKVTSTDASYSFATAFPTEKGYKYLVADGEGTSVYVLREVDNTPSLELPEGYDVEKYPFALFYDGTCEGFTHFANKSSADSETGDYRDVIQFARNKVSGASGAGKTVYILLTRDYTLDSTEYSCDKNGTLATELFYNWSQIGGTVVIDLGGHTLTMGAEALVYAECKTNHDSAVEFRNGTVELGAKSVVQYRSTTAMTTSKSFDVSFKNISFVLGENQSAALIGYSNLKSTVAVKAEVCFENCTFDYRAASESIKMFDLASTLLNVSLTVEGGRIIAGASALGNITFANLKTGNTAKFISDDDGKYTELYMPKGEVTTKTLPTDKGDKSFVRTGTAEYEKETYYVYAPGEKTFADYSPKMSITLDSQIVLNVYIPVESTQKFTIDGETYKNLALILDRIVILDDGNAYYHFSIAFASSKSAREVILEVTVEAEGAVANATFKLSVPKYAAKLIANGSETEKTLARDVLLYIREAYNYIGFAADNTVDEISRVNKLIESIIGDYKAAPVLSGTTNTVAGVTGVTLNLDETPAIRFYVTDATLEFFANGKKLNTVSGVDAENGAYIELDVYAYALAEIVTYGNGGSYHISDFVKGAEGTAYEALASAFVKYVESAAYYRHAVIEGNK